MAKFKTIDIVPGFGPLQTILTTVRATAEALSAALEPLDTAVNAVAPILGMLSDDKIDLTVAGQFFSEVLTVHLYPAQSYQAMRFRQWAEVAQRSLELSRTCFEPPYEILVFLLSSGSIAELTDKGAAMLEVWGRPYTGIEDKPGLAEVDRNLRRIHTGECRTLANDIPHVGELIGLLNQQVTVSVGNPIAGLAEALADKVEDFVERVESLRAVLEVLASFDLPSVQYTRFPVTSYADVATLLRTALDAPSGVEYVAGTVMVANTATAALIETILGVA